MSILKLDIFNRFRYGLSSHSSNVFWASFYAFIVSVPTLIISILVLFGIGLIGQEVPSFGDALEKIFHSLPFWNKQWDYAWTLYFSLIIAAICHISTVISLIKLSSKASHIASQPSSKTTYTSSYDPWDYMTTDEKHDYLIKNHNDIYNEVYHGIPRQSEIKKLREDLNTQWEKERKERNDRKWELEQQISKLTDELNKLNNK